MSASGDGTVGKALEVLDQIAAFGRPVRFAELQGGSVFPKATLYRLVQTLTHQGLLAFDPDRQTYAPGVRLVRVDGSRHFIMADQPERFGEVVDQFLGD